MRQMLFARFWYSGLFLHRSWSASHLTTMKTATTHATYPCTAAQRRKHEIGAAPHASEARMRHVTIDIWREANVRRAYYERTPPPVPVL